MPSKSKAQHNLMAMVAHDPKAAKRVGIPQSVGRDYVKADKGRKFGGSGMKTKKYAEGGAASDEARYGKIGAEIRRLDPEAYKNRPRSVEGNMALLKELRAKAARKDSSGSLAFKDSADTARRSAGFQATMKRAQEDARKEEAEDTARRSSGVQAMMERGRKDAQKKFPSMELSEEAEDTARRSAGFQAMMKRGREDAQKANSVFKYARGGGIESRGKTRGTIVKMAGGGSVGSASKRADGCAMKGKTKGRFV